MRTLEELKEHITSEIEVCYLMDVLDIPMEQLVELLSDVIDDNYDKLIKEFDLEEEQDD